MVAGSIEIDGTYIHDLTSVGACTDAGNIKLKDIVAYDVKLASRYVTRFSDFVTRFFINFGYKNNLI